MTCFSVTGTSYASGITSTSDPKVAMPNQYIAGSTREYDDQHKDNGDDKFNVTTLKGFSGALSLALGALALPDCAKHFGIGGANSMDPSSILSRAVNASARGASATLTFGTTPDGRASATTSAVGVAVATADPWAYQAPDGQRFEWTRAVININTDAWAKSSDAFRGVILIHELGHVFNALLGAGRSDFVYDALPDGGPNPAAEDANGKIMQDCIRY